MKPENKKDALSALKRLKGLTEKVELMIEAEKYCPLILEQLLAMKGHIKHVQSEVLESHLHTCAKEKMSTQSGSKKFIDDMLHAIGLSVR
jgi:DNA-binding FrmR family transcriptional regulator